MLPVPRSGGAGSLGLSIRESEKGDIHTMSECTRLLHLRRELQRAAGTQSLLKELNPAARVGKVYGVVSGKGGTGKTSFNDAHQHGARAAR